jgi:hypothetical protein
VREPHHFDTGAIASSSLSLLLMSPAFRGNVHMTWLPIMPNNGHGQLHVLLFPP